MLITINNPVGVDIPIQLLQKYMHDGLMEAWGLDVNDQSDNSRYKCLPRCYRNKNASGAYIAEWFDGGIDYKEAYWDDQDGIRAVSFFGIGSQEKHDVGEYIKVHLVFFVDVAALKPGIAHRADEEVRRDAVLLAEKAGYGFNFTGTELWLENVLREYPGSYRNERLTAVDMQPVHCFRLNFELVYNKNICLPEQQG